MVDYVREFEAALYGSQDCTPNMHAVLHMRDCIRDFGPVHAQWTFPWERMNGCMGAIPMNRHDVEQQFMRAFTWQQVLRSLPGLTGDSMTAEQTKLFESLWGEVRSAQRGFTSRHMITSLDLQRSPNLVTGNEPIAAQLVRPKQKQWRLDKDTTRMDFKWLRLQFAQWFPAGTCTVESFYDEAPLLELYGDRIGVMRSRLHRSSYVLYYHRGRTYPAQCITLIRPCVTVLINATGVRTVYRPLLARVRCYPRHGTSPNPSPMDDTLHRWYVENDKHGVPFTEEDKSMPKFVPVHRILSRFVMAPCSGEAEAAPQARLAGPTVRSRHKRCVVVLLSRRTTDQQSEARFCSSKRARYHCNSHFDEVRLEPLCPSPGTSTARAVAAACRAHCVAHSGR